MKQRKIQNKFKVMNQDKPGVVSMYLYGDIGDGFFDGINAKDVQKQLSNIEAEEIEVHINSYGGDMFESIAIHNLLKQKNAKITVVVDGIAASGGSVIAMAGDIIKMPNNAELMIHNPWTITAGNAEELRKVADDLEKMQSSLENSYMSRFNGSLEDLQQLLTDESYLTAEEALAYNLIDEIIADKVEEEATEDDFSDEVIDQIASRVAAKIKPETIKNKKEEPDEDLSFYEIFT